MLPPHASLQVTPLFFGPVPRLQQAASTARPEERLKSLRRARDPSPSCEPDSVYVVALLFTSNDPERFTLTLDQVFHYDEWIPVGTPGYVFLHGQGYQRVRVTVVDGVSKPAYFFVRNVEDTEISGTLSVMYRGRVLYQRRIEYHCDRQADDPPAGHRRLSLRQAAPPRL